MSNFFVPFRQKPKNAPLAQLAERVTLKRPRQRKKRVAPRPCGKTLRNHLPQFTMLPHEADRGNGRAGLSLFDFFQNHKLQASAVSKLLPKIWDSERTDTCSGALAIGSLAGTLDVEFLIAEQR
jgi:hypothetical protein